MFMVQNCILSRGNYNILFKKITIENSLSHSYFSSYNSDVDVINKYKK